MAASATDFVRDQLATGAGAAATLGAFPTALYVELASGSVVAVLTSDAVALPLGLVLQASSAVSPLDRYRSTVRIEAGVFVVGDLRVRAASDRSSKLTFIGTPVTARVAEARGILAAVADRTGLEAGCVTQGASSSSRRLAEALIGRGPGLTPAGDDFLCGLLAGGVAFGAEHVELRAAIVGALVDRPRATTSLSRQLLRLACEGHAIEAVTSFGHALCSPDPHAVVRATDRLLTIGHSSGVALGYGVLAAAGPRR